MKTAFSQIGNKLAGGSGIGELMDDLGQALAEGSPNLKMLGGGQPAQIPEVNEVWQRRLNEIGGCISSSMNFLSVYDPPKGNSLFIEAVRDLLKDTFDWNLETENICLTNGGQTAFFYLFNLLAGKMPDGETKKILFPLIPEYIGYAAQGLDSSMFHSLRPQIEELGPHEFKYHIDFENLEITPDIAAICISRPTNPTGNVLTDSEVSKLSRIAANNGIPLIIDNAYGAPFPNIIFSDATPHWDEHVILTLSLSKLGLPGTRTGIVIAPPEIISAIASMTAIIGLANPSTGQQITLPLIKNADILTMSDENIRPFYKKKSETAQEQAREIFGDRFPWKMHRSEGALFLWFWFPGLPMTCSELYQRLKKKEVLIIPGTHFFFGYNGPEWSHTRECIRVSFAMEEEIVIAGLTAIANEVDLAFKNLPGQKKLHA